jgi:SAM-dependent methyltransferase
MNLHDLYENRFSPEDQAWKAVVWGILYERVFGPLIAPGDVVLDLGAGYCEFINTVRASRRIAVDLSSITSEHAAPGVEVRASSADKLDFLPDRSVNVVFTSNFFEHLPGKGALTQVAAECFRVLVPGGRVIAMGPNIRFLYDLYWDYYDHQVALSDRSVCELLAMTGFRIKRCEPRFMPYTVKSRLPRWPLLVNAYLALRPLSSAFLGKQFLVVAEKPNGAEPEP